jgi:ABC-type polysaccharide/polyol phosphate transport system ATPase subunit
MDSIVEFDNVTLKLPVNAASGGVRGTTQLGGRIEPGFLHRQVLALRDVTFSLKPQDRVALIGGNGAGKTTLLRTAAGIYRPTAGRRTVRGRVSCLLNSGIGLSPNATGIENIRLACALYGLSGEAWRQAVAKASEFSELGPYLDIPMAHYSAGMRTRLGVSVVTTIDPEVLIIDEVFAAGDVEFAEKARKEIIRMMGRSKILMFASHSEGLLREFCNLGLLLHRGEVLHFGPLEEALIEYKTVRGL